MVEILQRAGHGDVTLYVDGRNDEVVLPSSLGRWGLYADRTQLKGDGKDSALQGLIVPCCGPRYGGEEARSEQEPNGGQ